MKINLKQLSCIFALTLLVSGISKAAVIDNTKYINPFIGTGGHGHTFPGAVLPNGMIQPSPDTRIYDWDACSGYYYADNTINGFSHTHLSGTGCSDYGDVLLMPTVGEQKINPLGAKSQKMAYASAFSHKNEIAKAGYYSVFLDTYKVKAELSATKRAAIHRYTFPASKESGFVLDFDYNIQGQTNDEMVLEVISDTEIRGHKKTTYWAFDQYINFYAKFSKPFTYTMVDDNQGIGEKGQVMPRKKVLIHFATAANEQVFVKVGVSAVDMEGAKKNVEAEIPNWDFNKVKADAHQAWAKHLSKIDIQTKDETQKTVFYTAMYHAAISPNLFTDVDGRYLGMDLKVHQSEANKPMYTVFSLWDTFRALHPLMTIIDPDLNNLFVNSLVQKSKEGGFLPMWELAGNETGTMIGYHAVPVIVDAYMKGYRDFDVKAAYKACLRIAEYDTTGIKCPKLVLACLMPKAKYYKNTIGYIPCDKENESVAKALEYAYNDWCISAFAEKMGDVSGQKKYAKLGDAYETYFDKSVRFMRGIDSNGKWRTPFNPRSSNHRNDDYCEGTAWQWTWFVPHKVDGLVKLMGGKKEFIGKLDSLFTASSALDGEATSSDISGLIGQYAHGNEPSHHITYLYAYVGQPWKTASKVREIMSTLYTDKFDGICGNEDVGQMSAWYVMSALGMYPVNPSNGCYVFGSPVVNSATIPVADNKTFQLTVKNNSDKNIYIQRITLNGKDYPYSYIQYKDIMKGGTLVMEMGSKPSTWATAPSQRPHSEM